MWHAALASKQTVLDINALPGIFLVNVNSGPGVSGDESVRAETITVRIASFDHRPLGCTTSGIWKRSERAVGSLNFVIALSDDSLQDDEEPQLGPSLYGQVPVRGSVLVSLTRLVLRAVTILCEMAKSLS